MVSSYVPLRLRSNYSLLTGTASIGQIIRQARQWGFSALALTDINNLYGAIAFYQQARQAQIKPILGVEIQHPTGCATLLARNLDGYANLCRIVSRRQLDEHFVLAETLCQFQEGLFVLTEDLALAAALADKMDHRYLWLDLVAPARSNMCRYRLREWAARHGLGVVATGDVYFLHRTDYALHRLLLAIGNNGLVSQVSSRQMAPPESYLASPEEMAGRYQEFPDLLANTGKIADACHLTLPLGKPIFPKFPLPADQTAYSHLYHQCHRGLETRYRPIGTEALERLTYELSVIQKLGFPEYFLIVADIVRYARDQGVPVVGRGSGASSIVAYLLGITSVDPLKYHLPFERFLNPGRPDCPDLDIDFCWKMRDQVIDYVYRTYGSEQVAMISTHNTFRQRSAFREVAKAWGIANDRITPLARLMPENPDEPFPQELWRLPGTGALNADTLNTIIQYARRIEGFPHYLSIHCGGIVIADKPIDVYVPLERAAKGIAITQYEMNAIEDIGLVKIDLLGNRALSTIRETVGIVAEQQNIHIDLEQLPDQDARTFQRIQRAQTLSCCQLESPAMRRLLAMLKPASMVRIIQALALIRPAPSALGMQAAFIRRARGMEPVTFLHPSLKPIVGDTYGILLYEDDAMLVANALAGLSLEEGDRLRKAIKKTKSKEDFRKLYQYFIAQTRKNGVADPVAQEIWMQMAKFNEYSFCRAHAAGYGLVAYQGAYLKTHYPAAYMVAALNNVQGIYPRRIHVWEAKRMGIEVLLPCVNRSQADYTLQAGRIRMGLSQIKGLTMQTMTSVVEESNRRPFQSVRDFLARLRCRFAELESLILVGGFDFTGLNRPKLLWQGHTLFGKVQAAPLDHILLPSLPETCDAPDLNGYSLEQKVDLEVELLECAVSAHPVALARQRLGIDGLIRSRDLPGHIGRQVRLLGYLATSRSILTKHDEVMQFLTLEDETGVFEVSLFPAVFEKCRPLLHQSGPFLVQGQVESQYDALTVTGNDLSLPCNLPPQPATLYADCHPQSYSPSSNPHPAGHG